MNLEKLPEMCFGVLKSTGETILIKRGESGYYPQPHYNGVDVDELNKELWVTKPQRMAMEAGSMFGWNVPAANPEVWEEVLNNKEEIK